MGRRRESFPKRPESEDFFGRDFAGRGHFSAALPWVRKDAATGEILLDVERARENGIEISYDEATREVVIERG